MVSGSCERADGKRRDRVGMLDVMQPCVRASGVLACACAYLVWCGVPSVSGLVRGWRSRIEGMLSSGHFDSLVWW